MTTTEYLKLRNGASVRGIATALIEDQQVTLTEDAVQHIAKAFCVWLISHTGKTKVSVAVGFDARLSSPSLCEAAVGGILSTGHDAVVNDLSSVPAMRMLLQDASWQAQYPCDGAIMITGGCLPKQYNGMQFFFGGHSLDNSSLESILDIAGTYRYAEPSTPGQRIEVSYMREYANRIVQIIREKTGDEMPLLNKKIIVDAGNGVGGFFVDSVLIPLGASTEGSQNLTANGNFPNYIPNPNNKAAIASLAQAVIASKAHLGILISADGDRICAVDKDGTPFNRNTLIALISSILLKEKPGTIVTDSGTSNGLTAFINARGGKHHRFVRGAQNIINEATRLNGLDEYTPLAIDTCGNAALLENDFQFDSGYLIARLLITFVKLSKEEKTLSDLIVDLQQPKEVMDVCLPLNVTEDFHLDATRAICEYAAYAERTPYVAPVEDNLEGSRVNYDEKHGNGWVMLRACEQCKGLPLHIESDSEHGALKMAKDVYYFLKGLPSVDVAPLKDAIEQERQRLLGNIKTDFYSDAAYLTFIFGEKVVIQQESEPQAEEATSTESTEAVTENAETVEEPTEAEAVAEVSEPVAEEVECVSADDVGEEAETETTEAAEEPTETETTEAAEEVSNIVEEIKAELAEEVEEPLVAPIIVEEEDEEAVELAPATDTPVEA